MNIDIQNEICERLAILVEQGLNVEYDIKETTLAGDLSVSYGVKMPGGFRVGIVNPISHNPEFEGCLNKAIDITKSLQVTPYLALYIRIIDEEFISVLYVSNDKNEWANDKEFLKNKNAISFNYNLTEDYGKVGKIQYKLACGGLVIIK